MKTSTLNPLASSFVPSKPRLPSEMVSLGKIPYKIIANKYLQDLIEEKRRSNDNAITREEISAIVLKLISYGKGKFQNFDPVILKAYLRSKVPEALSIKPLVAKKIEPKPQKADDKNVAFDLSAFKVPKDKVLLVSLWGLHRQEQAFRPMISLSHRPEPLEDPVWSVTEKDLKLWNAHAVEKPCACPPMFGYALPPGFFGNPLKVDFACDLKSLHLNRYPERPDGNELALIPSARNTFMCLDVFEEPEDKPVFFKKNLDFYLQEFKTIVNNVCSMIAEEKENEDEFDPNESDTPTCYMEALWDSDVKENRPKADQVAEDDNCHPLLDGFRYLEEPRNEGVATNIKELIRRSLSSETTDSGISEDCCDPPCSDWCHSSPPKCTTRTSEALSLLKDTTDFILGASDITSRHDSAPSHRPSFKRSFSANDCDAYLKKLPPTHETLGFLRKDPLVFRKLKDPIDSWKDSDSGIGSNCSSPEDSRDYGFEEGDENADVDMAPMWSLFSGEGSLWQPLPCPNQEDTVKFPHKRVKELRRLQSMT